MTSSDFSLVVRRGNGKDNTRPEHFAYALGRFVPFYDGRSLDFTQQYLSSFSVELLRADEMLSREDLADEREGFTPPLKCSL